MPQLSILVSHCGGDEQLERTLVSVLENRPADAEVIVSHNSSYGDPYDLAGEVLFVSGSPRASSHDLISVGMGRACGDVIHLLHSGFEVTPGWDCAALKHFARPKIAAVAPVVVNAAAPDRVISAGVRLCLGGHCVNGAGVLVHHVGEFRREIIGPSSTAAFYRSDVLRRLLEQPTVVGQVLTDVDWGLSLCALGQETRIEPGCQILGQHTGWRPSAYESGRWHERLFWRHADQAKPWSGWVHAACWLRQLTSPMGLAGRIAGFSERKRIAADYRRWLEQWQLDQASGEADTRRHYQRAA